MYANTVLYIQNVNFFTVKCKNSKSSYVVHKKIHTLSKEKSRSGPIEILIGST